jgi:major type 1 subunit fimbrin (pilin)
MRAALSGFPVEQRTARPPFNRQESSMSISMRRFKRLAIALSLVVISMLREQRAYAADGRIQFNGTISDQTCKINGSDKNADLVVSLPKVNTSALSTPNDRAGLVSFVLKLTGCKAKSGTVYPHFLMGETVDPTTGRLFNSSRGLGGAKNVQIKLLGSDLGVLQLARDSGDQNVLKAELEPVSAGEPAVTTGEATMKFYSQYVASGGPATTGELESTVLYEMVYP